MSTITSIEKTGTLYCTREIIRQKLACTVAERRTAARDSLPNAVSEVSCRGDSSYLWRCHTLQ